jgi:hypothetical protein
MKLSDESKLRIIDWGLTRAITLTSLRQLIRDYNLVAGQTILLHPVDFEKVVLEHRNYFGYSMRIPHLIEGVKVREDFTKRVLVARVGVLRG